MRGPISNIIDGLPTIVVGRVAVLVLAVAAGDGQVCVGVKGRPNLPRGGGAEGTHIPIEDQGVRQSVGFQHNCVERAGLGYFVKLIVSLGNGLCGSCATAADDVVQSDAGCSVMG